MLELLDPNKRDGGLVPQFLDINNRTAGRILALSFIALQAVLDTAMNFVEHGARQAERALELPLGELAVELIERCGRKLAVGSYPRTNESATAGEGMLAGRLALSSSQHP